MAWHFDCVADGFDELVLEYTAKKCATVNYDTRTGGVEGVGDGLERCNACLGTCAVGLKVLCAAVLYRTVVYRSTFTRDSEW